MVSQDAVRAWQKRLGEAEGKLDSGLKDISHVRRKVANTWFEIVSQDETGEYERFLMETVNKIEIRLNESRGYLTEALRIIEFLLIELSRGEGAGPEGRGDWGVDRWDLLNWGLK